MSKPLRKPTRRDLLVVIGRLQGLIGSVPGAANDRNPNSAAQLRAISDIGMDLCISATSYDAQASGGPWEDGEQADWAWKDAS